MAPRTRTPGAPHRAAPRSRTSRARHRRARRPASARPAYRTAQRLEPSRPAPRSVRHLHTPRPAPSSAPRFAPVKFRAPHRFCTAPGPTVSEGPSRTARPQRGALCRAAQSRPLLSSPDGTALATARRTPRTAPSRARLPLSSPPPHPAPPRSGSHPNTQSEFLPDASFLIIRHPQSTGRSSFRFFLFQIPSKS